MSDSETKESNGNGSPQVGALLRASRLRVGEDLREIADVLCIRYLYLEAIEECRYADLPGSTYAVGFIRSYADHLGLDGEEVVRRFKVEQDGAKRADSLSFPTPVPESGMPKGAIVFIGVLLALLVYGGWYATTTDESILSDLISPVPDHLKHLVTGDDARQNAMTVPGDTSSGSTQTPNEDAQSRMAETASEVASRAAEAARDAAQVASGAVTSSVEESASPTESAASAVTEQAATTVEAETPVEQAQEAVATATETVAETTPSEPVVPAAPVEEATSAQTPAPLPEPASAPEAAAVEPAPAPAPAATETVTETASTPVATPETETPATSAPETSAAAEAAPEPEVAAAPAPQPREPQPTAEDLNARSLRGEPASTASTEAEAPTPAPVASTSTAPASGIVIRAQESSWVEVRDPSNGRVVFTGLMSAGATYAVPNTKGLILDTGNAGGLDITVDGVSVPKLGRVGDVRKGVALDSDRLKAGTATNR